VIALSSAAVDGGFGLQKNYPQRKRTRLVKYKRLEKLRCEPKYVFLAKFQVCPVRIVTHCKDLNIKTRFATVAVSPQDLLHRQAQTDRSQKIGRDGCVIGKQY